MTIRSTVRERVGRRSMTVRAAWVLMAAQDIGRRSGARQAGLMPQGTTGAFVPGGGPRDGAKRAPPPRRLGLDLPKQRPRFVGAPDGLQPMGRFLRVMDEESPVVADERVSTDA